MGQHPGQGVAGARLRGARRGAPGERGAQRLGGSNGRGAQGLPCHETRRDSLSFGWWNERRITNFILWSLARRDYAIVPPVHFPQSKMKQSYYLTLPTLK